jgi:hypothetical protein
VPGSSFSTQSAESGGTGVAPTCPLHLSTRTWSRALCARARRRDPAGSGQAAFGGRTEQKQTFAVRRPNRRVRPILLKKSERRSTAHEKEE